jgi:hypothetical protein
MLLLAAGAITAVRNVVWFNFAAVVVLPLSIDAAVRAGRGGRSSHPRLNLAILGLATVALMLAAVASARRSPTGRYYSTAGLAAVRRAVTVDPSLRVFADERYADWLLWRLPALRGRVAYDARFELLRGAEIAAIVIFKDEIGPQWRGSPRATGCWCSSGARQPPRSSSTRREPGSCTTATGWWSSCVLGRPRVKMGPGALAGGRDHCEHHARCHSRARYAAIRS